MFAHIDMLFQRLKGTLMQKFWHKESFPRVKTAKSMQAIASDLFAAQ
jgi:hypothetical protein